MSARKIRPLAEGFTAEVDVAGAEEWSRLLPQFEDANIFQTWSYAAVVEGRRNTGNLLLKRDGETVAMAQARVKSAPLPGVGVAYVRYGPVWRRMDAGAGVEIFRQTVRALRNEYVCKRGYALRLFPLLFEDDSLGLSAVLEEEGFAPLRGETPDRTILMDLPPTLDELRAGMERHCRQALKTAEKNDLEIVEGTSGELFDRFLDLYTEMLSRKKFVAMVDVREFKEIQAQLPEELKLRIVLCRSEGADCAGAIYSALGKYAIYMFGATGNLGMTKRGSYLLQWKIFEELKRKGATLYDLNGIDPVKNPGTYQFKKELAGKFGRDVRFAGKFDAFGSLPSRSLVLLADTLKRVRRDLKLKMAELRDKPKRAEK
jgi:lipid II:glycine glycyltransferase (peptidoglycan interpeptide bridge formation enzyme)